MDRTADAALVRQVDFRYRASFVTCVRMTVFTIAEILAKRGVKLYSSIS
jgi:hypothetical protein